MKKVSLFFLIALLVSTSGVFASGLSIPEQGAAAMGMSAAMTARSEDLSSIYYNPAGMDYIQKSESFIGLTPIMPRHKFSSDSESLESEKKAFVPPNLYFGHRFSDRVVFGFGMFTPYGLGTDWNEDWNGRYTSTYSEVKSLYVTPALSVKVFEMLSVGLSYSWIWSDAAISKKIDSGLAIYGATAALDPASANPMMVANPKYDSEFALEGDGGGTSYTLGMMLRPMDRLQIGLTYTGETELVYEGMAKFSHPVGYEAMLGALMPGSQSGEAVLKLPSSFNIGAKLDITSKWDAEIDLNFVNWSAYDSLTIDLSKGLPTSRLAVDKHWDDTMVFRLGTSYDLSDVTTLRFGFLSDKAPIPSETYDAQLPDGDRLGFSLGIGRELNIGGVPIRLDASYMYLQFKDTDKDNYVGYQDVGSIDGDTGLPTNLMKDGVVNVADQAIMDSMMTQMGRGLYPVGNGTYESHANLFSVSATYRF